MKRKIPSPKHYDNFGSILRELRMNAGLTQKEVAEEFNFNSAQFVSNWERGENEPPAKYLRALANLFSVNPDDLIETYIVFVSEKIRENASKESYQN